MLIVLFSVGGFLSVSFVHNVACIFGLWILDCPFGFLLHLFYRSNTKTSAAISLKKQIKTKQIRTTNKRRQLLHKSIRIHTNIYIAYICLLLPNSDSFQQVEDYVRGWHINPFLTIFYKDVFTELIQK
jgi:hypothetical protein